MIDLNDKVIVITGASRGIGAATAIAAARQGAKVLVNFNSDEISARSVVDKITESGGSAISFKADVSNMASVQHRMGL